MIPFRSIALIPIPRSIDPVRRVMYVVALSACVVAGCVGRAQNQALPLPSMFTAAMPVPLELVPVSRTDALTTYDITAQHGTTKFLASMPSVETFGYNGNLLGPTIRIRRGENVAVVVRNRLLGGHKTNIHWHGLRVSAAADGPHNDIPPDGTFTARFRVVQPAATLWYHPHWGNSGFQTYKGLAGFLYIDDPASDALKLPHSYGVDDFPLMIQDKSFYPDGRLQYMAQAAAEGRR